MILALTMALACTSAPPEPAPSYTPAVVVIVTDTVRAGLAGADAPGWLDGGRVYSRAYSASPWTSSSTATLVTGRNPTGDERLHPGGGEVRCDGTRQGAPLPSSWPADAWPTRVITDHVVVARMNAAAEVHPWRGPGSEATVAAGIDALSDPATGAALYLHTLGAHEPYDGLLPGPGLTLSATAREWKAARQCGEITPDLGAWARLSYRTACQRVTASLAPLVQAARASGAVVIWTSDHGEALGEDDRWGHATDLHDAQIRVPLVVWGPGVEPGTDDAIVPGTCVGQTARLVLGEVGDLCDLRTGDIRGEAVSGILDEAGVWQVRVIR